MKKPIAFLIGGLILCGAVLLAQTDLDFPPRWSPATYRFEINGIPHSARIEHRALLATPSWNPSKALPMSFDAVEQVARQELRKLVTNDAPWLVEQFHINRLMAPTNTSKWYYTVQFKSTVPRGVGVHSNWFDYAEVLVDFSGQPGFFDDN